MTDDGRLVHCQIPCRSRSPRWRGDHWVTLMTGRHKKAPFKRDQLFLGCHPEVNPIFSSPGARPGWQPLEKLAATERQELIYHYYMRLHYLLRLHREAREE